MSATAANAKAAKKAMLAGGKPVMLKFDNDTVAEVKAMDPAISKSPLFHKTMLVLGDTFALNGETDDLGDAWHTQIAKKYHMKYINIAHPGTHMAFDMQPSLGGKAWCHRLGEIRSADYIVLMTSAKDGDYIYGSGTDAKGRPIPHAPADIERHKAEAAKNLTTLVGAIRQKAGKSGQVFLVLPYRPSIETGKFVLEKLTELGEAQGMHVYNVDTMLNLNPHNKEDQEKYFTGRKTFYYNDAANAMILKHIEPWFLDPGLKLEVLPERADKGKHGKKEKGEKL